MRMGCQKCGGFWVSTENAQKLMDQRDKAVMLAGALERVFQRWEEQAAYHDQRFGELDAQGANGSAGWQEGKAAGLRQAMRDIKAELCWAPRPQSGEEREQQCPRCTNGIIYIRFKGEKTMEGPCPRCIADRMARSGPPNAEGHAPR